VLLGDRLVGTVAQRDLRAVITDARLETGCCQDVDQLGRATLGVGLRTGGTTDIRARGPAVFAGSFVERGGDLLLAQVGDEIFDAFRERCREQVVAARGKRHAEVCARTLVHLGRSTRAGSGPPGQSAVSDRQQPGFRQAVQVERRQIAAHTGCRGRRVATEPRLRG
jgi:hypothetical protein